MMVEDACRGNMSLNIDGVQKVVRLADGTLTIGRAHDCDVVVTDAKVSRHHLRINVTPSEVAVMDTESSGGTVVDGVRVNAATLADGSVVTVGDTQIFFELFHVPKVAEAQAEEFIEIESGVREPTVVETLVPGELTVSHDGIQQAFHDLTVPRLVVYTPDATTIEYPLTKDRTLIGRDPACDIVLTDAAASRQHAALDLLGRQVILRDLDSKNGTYLRASPVQEQALFNGVNFRIGDTFLVYKAGQQPGDISKQLEQGAGVRRPVVVLPGIMGSELYQGDQLFWPNLSRALRDPTVMSVGRRDSLRLGGIARRIIVVKNFIKLDAYSELVGFLEEELGYVSGQDLLEFPYDWRQDNRDSAEKLKIAVDNWRRDVIGMDTKFTILCHSMGALVSRYYLNCLGGNDHVEKFISLAGAHFGAPFVIQGLMYGPNLLPLGFGRKNLHATLVTMPSAYQLVPPYPTAYGPDGKVIDLHKDDRWVMPEHRHLLRSARDFHHEIGRSTSVPTTCIFGYGVKTVTRIQVDKHGDGGWEKVRFLIEPAGDNRVVDRYGYLEGADIHPVKQHHGSLWNDNDVKMRIRLELLSGMPA
ncbi:MAG: FHA domain-containing protein [Pseudomonadales bacterium]